MSAKDTTDNFMEFWKDFQWPDPLPVTYRLYHDDQGMPLFYTMENLPGQYITVDQATYIYGSFGVRVVDGNLIVLPSRSGIKILRVDADEGTICDPRDICVVVSQKQPHVKWRLQDHDVD